MITEKTLNKYLTQWKDVTVVTAPWDSHSVLIILIFDKKEIGKEFLELLSTETFGFSATNNKGEYSFFIAFPNYDHIGLERLTETPFGHYDFLKWYNEGRLFYITNGIWLNGDPKARHSDFGGGINVPVTKMFFE